MHTMKTTAHLSKQKIWVEDWYCVCGSSINMCMFQERGKSREGQQCKLKGNGLGKEKYKLLSDVLSNKRQGKKDKNKWGHDGILSQTATVNLLSSWFYFKYSLYKFCLVILLFV